MDILGKFIGTGVIQLIGLAFLIWWLVSENKKKKTIYAIVKNGVRDIEEMASATQLEQKKIIKILHGIASSAAKVGTRYPYCRNSYVDLGRNCFVVPEKAVKQPKKKNLDEPVKEAKTDEKAATKVCLGCGAENPVTAEGLTECKFCGSQLNN